MIQQLSRVRTLMLDGRWRTLAEISKETDAPQASVSARIRDLRKDKFGGYAVRIRRRGDKKRGIFEYRVLVGGMAEAVRMSKRTRAQSGRLSQKKGKEYQKEIARIIAEHLNLPPEEFYSALAGMTGADIAASRVGRKLFPFAIETKDCKQINMASWLAEAEANADGVGLPFALIFKLHGRRRNYITLELSEFLRWVS